MESGAFVNTSIWEAQSYSTLLMPSKSIFKCPFHLASSSPAPWSPADLPVRVRLQIAEDPATVSWATPRSRELASRTPRRGPLSRPQLGQRIGGPPGWWRKCSSAWKTDHLTVLPLRLVALFDRHRCEWGKRSAGPRRRVDSSLGVGP